MPDKLLLAEGFHAPHRVIGTHVQIPFPVDAQRQVHALQRILGRYQAEAVVVRIGEVGRYAGGDDAGLGISRKRDPAYLPVVVERTVLVREISANFVRGGSVQGIRGPGGKLVRDSEILRCPAMPHQPGLAIRTDIQIRVIDQQHIVHPHLVAFHHFAEIVACREAQQKVVRIGSAFILDRRTVTNPLPVIVLYLDIGRTYHRAGGCISIGSVLEFAIIMQVQGHIPVPATILSQLGPENNGIGTAGERPAFGPVTGIRIDTRRTIPLIIIIIQYPRSQSSHIFIRTRSKRELIMVPR